MHATETVGVLYTPFHTPPYPSSLSFRGHVLSIAPPVPIFLQDVRTPLQWAAMHGHLESVRLLLDRGANTDAKGKVRGEDKGDRVVLWVQCAVEGALTGLVVSVRCEGALELLRCPHCNLIGAFVA